jgi:hypothetical protein
MENEEDVKVNNAETRSSEKARTAKRTTSEFVGQMRNRSS